MAVVMLADQGPKCLQGYQRMKKVAASKKGVNN